MHIRPLKHFNERPADTKIDTVIIHSMTNCTPEDLQPSAERCCELLDNNEVSAHYLITPEGEIWQCVSENNRAWHAGTGKSKMPYVGALYENDSQGLDNRGANEGESINDFSIGIELITPLDNSFTDAQYEKLNLLLSEIISRHPIKNILGHDHIAPGRKTDPGEKFDWRRIYGAPSSPAQSSSNGSSAVRIGIKDGIVIAK